MELLIELVSAVGTLGIGAVIWRAFLEPALKGSIDQVFKERLERVRLSNQRELQRHGVYVARRMEVIAEIYSRCRQAEGHVAGLWGYQTTHDWASLNSEDAEYLMQQEEFPPGRTRELIDIWDSDRQRAADGARIWLRRIQIQRAQNRIIEARNYLTLNELYVPAEVADRAHAVLDAMRNFAAGVESLNDQMAPGEQKANFVRASSDALRQIEADMASLRTYLRQQLRLVEGAELAGLEPGDQPPLLTDGAGSSSTTPTASSSDT